MRISIPGVTIAGLTPVAPVDVPAKLQMPSSSRDGLAQIEVQLLYPDVGTIEPLTAVAKRYELDLEGLQAAAQSALAAPDRVVSLELAGRSPA
jgi:hypothetical protein